jgi:hypothetical protein
MTARQPLREVRMPEEPNPNPEEEHVGTFADGNPRA